MNLSSKAPVGFGKMKVLVVALCIAVAALGLQGCQAWHDRQHLDDPTRLGDGRTFDIYSNARCAHLANIFRPDRVTKIKAGIPLIVGGQYYTSEEWVRVTEPILVTINQITLQACIQLELGEISPAEYSEIIRSNSARYMSLIPKNESDVRAQLVSSIVNSVLQEVGSNEELDKDELISEADELRSQVYADASEAEANLSSIRSEVDQFREQQAQGVSPAVDFIASGFDTNRSSDLASSQPEIGLIESHSFIYVLFNHDSSDILDRDLKRISDFVERNCCEKRFVVYGFADETGPDDYNRMLSRLRGNAVAEAVTSTEQGAIIDKRALGQTNLFGPLLADNRVVYLGVIE